MALCRRSWLSTESCAVLDAPDDGGVFFTAKAHHNSNVEFEQATKLVKKLILSKKFPNQEFTKQTLCDDFFEKLNKCLCECY
jgi:hypothetical protein